ncbi:MAG: DapH/DapD/GlmU-related protein [Faecousia sp.]
MTMREKIAAGKLFTDMCEGLEEERLEAKRRQKAFNDSDPADMEGRVRMMSEMLAQGDGIWIEPPFYFCYGKHISIGQGSYLNVNCNFIDDGTITIGKAVMFGPAVTIATVGHPINPDLRGYMYCDPVVIGDNVWIGAGTVICPGVHIGNNTVIGAGSVVVGDIPADCIAVGNPCKVLRPIDERDRKYYYKDRLFDPSEL